MNDRELLEFSAKAVGLKPLCYEKKRHAMLLGSKRPLGFRSRWNPLLDDGDALRLACRLRIPIFPYDDETSTGTTGVVAKNWGSIEANTRRAIVRAAAEIGKAMP